MFDLGFLLLFLVSGAPNEKWKMFLEFLFRRFVFWWGLYLSGLVSSVAQKADKEHVAFSTGCD